MGLFCKTHVRLRTVKELFSKSGELQELFLRAAAASVKSERIKARLSIIEAEIRRRNCMEVHGISNPQNSPSSTDGESV